MNTTAIAVDAGTHPGEPAVADHAASAQTPAPVDVRGAALSVIAVLATVFALHWAQFFCVSLLLGILLAYMLNPVVGRMELLRIPRTAGAVIAVAALVFLCVLAADTLGGQVRAILEQLPEAAGKVSARLVQMRNGEPGTMAKVQAAAQVIEQATNQVAEQATAQATEQAAAQATEKVAARPAPARPVARVVVEQPGFKVSSFLLANTVGAMMFAGQAVMIAFLVFFLLASGDAFKRKLVKLAGPSLSRRRITVQVLDDIDTSMQKFMLMLLATNTLLAVLTWLALRALGLENAGAWGLAAGLMHVVPYVGPALLAAAVGMAALLQFETFSMTFAAAGATLAISAFVGFVVATWMTGKLVRMNSAAIFVALLFWGWLWGAWGLLLAIPIIAAMKVAAELVEPLHPVAELLGQ